MDEITEALVLSEPADTPPLLDPDSVFHDGSPSALDFLSVLGSSPGYVVDEALAREAPCVAFELGTTRLVFSRGVVGSLTDDQQALYCSVTQTREPSEDQRARILALQESAESCRAAVDDDAEGQIQPWLRCLREELRARNQEL